MWSIYKQFKNKKTHIPQEITVDDIANVFQELSWNFTPKNISISSHIPLNDIAFSLQPITRNSDNYFKNFKAMELDNKNSDYSYGTDTIS